MYHVGAQGIDECMINVHYYYTENESNVSSHSYNLFSARHTAAVWRGEIRRLQVQDQVQEDQRGLQAVCSHLLQRLQGKPLYNAVTCFHQPLNLSPPAWSVVLLLTIDDMRVNSREKNK